jgi:uncharacterized protein YbjT (DUF2867 family)
VSSSGGSVLNTLLNSDKPALKNLQISVLVRSEEQAKRFTELGVTPILFTDLNDVEVIQKAASEHDGEFLLYTVAETALKPAYSCCEYS